VFVHIYAHITPKTIVPETNMLSYQVLSNFHAVKNPLEKCGTSLTPFFKFWMVQLNISMHPETFKKITSIEIS